MLEGPVVLGEAEWHAIDVRQGATTLMEGLKLLVDESLEGFRDGRNAKLKGGFMAKVVDPIAAAVLPGMHYLGSR